MWPLYCPASVFHPQPDHMNQWNDWISECKPMGSLSSSAYLNSCIFCFNFLFLKSGSGQNELINYLNLIIYYVFPESTRAFFQNSPFPQLYFLYLFCLPILPMSSNCLSRIMVKWGVACKNWNWVQLWPHISPESQALAWSFFGLHLTWLLPGNQHLLLALQGTVTPNTPAPGTAQVPVPKASVYALACSFPCWCSYCLPLLYLFTVLLSYQPAFGSQFSCIKWPEVKQ